MAAEQKLSKNVKALGIVSLLNDMSTDMIYPLIPVFLRSILGASYATVGLIEGIAESTASLLKVFSGWLSDKMRKRKTLTVIGYSLSMIAKPLLVFAQSSWHVLLVRFSDRFGKGIRQAPRDALIAESTKPETLGYAYGFHKAMDTAGATIGPILAIILLALFKNNIRLIFLLSGVASFLAVMTLVIVVKEKKDGFPPRRSRLTLRGLPRSYRWFLVGIGLFSLGNSSDAFLFLRAEDLGITIGLIPLLYALANLVFAGCATFFGKLSDRIGTHKIMLGGYFVFALTYLGFALAHVGWLMWLLFPLYGVFSSMTESIQKTITVHGSRPEMKGTMLGILHMTIGICQLPASLLAGLLWQHVSAQAPFFFGSGMAIIGFLVLCYSFSLQKKSTATA